MSKPYLMQIDEQIGWLQDQIDELLTAKRVIEVLMKGEASATYTAGGHGTPSTKATARKHPKKELKHPNSVKYAALVNIIANVLSHAPEPIQSGDIINRMAADDINYGDKQRVWSALSNMKQRGMISHDARLGTYELVREHVNETAS